MKNYWRDVLASVVIVGGAFSYYSTTCATEAIDPTTQCRSPQRRAELKKNYEQCVRAVANVDLSGAL